MTSAIEIVQAGWSTTVQDLGRPGWSHLGVSPSGAVDPALAARANRMIGNPPDRAVLETAGGLIVRAVGAIVVAATTEAVPRVVADGELVSIAVDPERRWHYLAIRGGLDVEPVLGSRATDTLAGIGPDIPATGDRLSVGREPDGVIVGEPVPLEPLPDSVRVTAGPRAEWITGEATDALFGATWTVGAVSRIGIRLGGPVLTRAVPGELPSEGLVRGAIQVPPDGQPVVMLADHPTTGGYPVVAVVRPDDLATLAQAPDGKRIRLRR